MPIKIEDCDSFDPLTVPNLISIKKELDEYKDSDEKMADYKKTSLKPYYEYFEKFVMNIIMEVKRNKKGNYICSRLEL